MEKIYSIQKSQILEVKGVFDYIGEDYEKIYVRSTTKLSKPFVEDTIPASLQQKLDEPLKLAKARKIEELNKACDNLLLSFSSSALGEEYIYDGSLEDQINLMGAVNMGVDMPFRCKKANSETKENIPHTKEQLAQVFSDGVNYKASVIYKCGALKSEVEQLTDINKINAISFATELPNTQQETTKKDKA